MLFLVVFDVVFAGFAGLVLFDAAFFVSSAAVPSAPFVRGSAFVLVLFRDAAVVPVAAFFGGMMNEI